MHILTYPKQDKIYNLPIGCYFKYIGDKRVFARLKGLKALNLQNFSVEPITSSSVQRVELPNNWINKLWEGNVSFSELQETLDNDEINELPMLCSI